MSRIFWDTNLFIYLFEGSGKFSIQVLALRGRMLERGDQLMTSAITLGEILVKPIQIGDVKAVAYYQQLIATTAAVIPFEEKAALAYARLRADRSEEHTSELQSPCNLVCRLLLEKKKKNKHK